MSKKTFLQNLTAGAPMSRRTFVGRVGAAAGGVAVAAVLPLSNTAEAAKMPRAPSVEPDGDWHVDDMVCGFPRYAQPIGYAPARSDVRLAAYAEPVDYQLLIC